MIHVVRQPKKETQNDREITQRLSKLHRQSEEEFAARLAHKNSLPYIDLHLIPINNDHVFLIPKERAAALRIVSFHRKGRIVRIGTPYPEDREVQEYIAELRDKNHWDVTLVVISPSSLARGLAEYDHVFFLNSLHSLRLTLTGKDLEAFDAGVGKLLQLKDHIDTIPTTEVLTIIFAGGIKLGASDIHIEPEEEHVRLRYRIDGVLQDVIEIPLKIYKSITSRIKLMGKVKINIRDIAQDGHFTFTIDDNKIDVRMSTVPSKYGESIVMRLLDTRGLDIELSDLGMKGRAYTDLQKNIIKNTGMILTTGPTGSGKTTTLYTIINTIKSPESKIITIEDPIEYAISDVVQTQVSKNKDYTFNKGLRAIVRQDPDIILVGEIRDEETADIAVNAALTGHLLLSTLHTNNAPATIARFFELGVRPTLIPPASNIFMAQRLVRKLCTCKEEYVPAEETKGSLMEMLSLISPKAELELPKSIEKLYRTVGCQRCHGTGYKGRIGIFEVLTMNENLEKLVLDMASETEIMRSAIEDGFVTMTQDGILKAINGDTAMEEIWRVTSEGDIIKELYDNLMDQSLGRSLFVSKTHDDLTSSTLDDVHKIGTQITTAEEKDILPILFSYGVSLRASDIHIEPQEDHVQIRIRIDGVLQKIASLTLTEYPILLGKIKNLSGIPTTVRQGVSDSRFSVLLEKEEETQKIDVRISIIVGGYGETAVMRLLNRDTVNLEIDSLGLRPYNVDLLMREARKPYGVVLATGPTGSGKTTTLYSIIQEIKDVSLKIITVEDPIEYQVSGILQTQVNKKSDYTFPTALRSLLRQDPDIILVGEIRDDETADTAISAALTGHLILSAIHTNDAIGAIQRLMDLGVQSDNLISAVNAATAQRLARKLCDCKTTTVPTPAQKELLEKTLASISNAVPIPRPSTDTLYAPNGCSKCNGIGFRGRTVISEVLVFDTKIQDLIAHGALPSEIKSKAIELGMLTMEQDAALKVVEGKTTLEEVQRVTML